MSKKWLAIAKKAMVWTLASSMLVATPLTASAAGLRGVYSIHDGTETVKENPNDSGTGTVTNTNTESGTSVLEKYDAEIIGIVLDKESVNAEKGKPEKLTATVVLDGSIGAEEKAEIQKQLASKIRWEVSNADGEKNPNPAATLGISSSAADRSVVTLNPKKGTKLGKEIIVTAEIDRSYYWVEKRDENGDVVRDENGKPVLEMKDTGIEGDPYTASAKVFVKEYSDKLSFDVDKIALKLTDGKSTDYTALLKHTVDLSDCIIRTPSSANDTITWISTDTKVATVTAAGVVTFKKVGSGSILAVGEKGARATYEFVVAEGQAASRIEIVDDEGNLFNRNKKDVNLTSDDPETFDAGVNVYAKMKNVIVSNSNSKKAANNEEDFARKSNGEVKVGTVEVKDGDVYYTASDDKKNGVQHGPLYITDTITWTSNKQGVATVNGDTDGATVTALGVGKAVITAKASSGKSAKLNVAVNAPLLKLEIGDVPEKLYTGQTVVLSAIKTPRANNDGVTWSIAKSGTKKNPNASINAKGELKINAQLKNEAAYVDADGTPYVEVELKSKKKYDKANEDGATVKDYVYAEKVKISLAQSSVESISVMEGDTAFATAAVERNTNGTIKKVVKNQGIPSAQNTKTINVPKGKTYDIVATATDGEEGDASTLAFKVSNAKFADIKPSADGSRLTVTAKAKGTSTVTVSGVSKSGTAVKPISTTFKVNVVQPVRTITMNKPSVTVVEKLKNGNPADQAIALKATLGPKGVNAKEVLTWTYKKTKDAGVDVDSEFVRATDARGKDLTKASASVNLPAPKVGDQYIIKVESASGVSATTTVDVVTKTTAVVIAKKLGLDEDGNPVIYTEGNKRNTINARIGQPIKMYPYVNTGKANAPVWDAAGQFVAADGENRARNIEDVSYSVNKKGIVTIDADGTVHVINKGTVTITAKTPMGKKGTLKVVVSTNDLYVAPEN